VKVHSEGVGVYGLPDDNCYMMPCDKNLIPNMLMLEDVCFRSWPCELGSLVIPTLLVIIF
jgi:hypothetical protein